MATTINARDWRPAPRATAMALTIGVGPCSRGGECNAAPPIRQTRIIPKGYVCRGCGGKGGDWCLCDNEPEIDSVGTPAAAAATAPASGTALDEHAASAQPPADVEHADVQGHEHTLESATTGLEDQTGGRDSKAQAPAESDSSPARASIGLGDEIGTPDSNRPAETAISQHRVRALLRGAGSSPSPPACLIGGLESVARAPEESVSSPERANMGLEGEIGTPDANRPAVIASPQHRVRALLRDAGSSPTPPACLIGGLESEARAPEENVSSPERANTGLGGETGTPDANRPAEAASPQHRVRALLRDAGSSPTPPACLIGGLESEARAPEESVSSPERANMGLGNEIGTPDATRPAGVASPQHRVRALQSGSAAAMPPRHRARPPPTGQQWHSHCVAAGSSASPTRPTGGNDVDDDEEEVEIDVDEEPFDPRGCRIYCPANGTAADAEACSERPERGEASDSTGSSDPAEDTSSALTYRRYMGISDAPDIPPDHQAINPDRAEREANERRERGASSLAFGTSALVRQHWLEAGEREGLDADAIHALTLRIEEGDAGGAMASLDLQGGGQMIADHAAHSSCATVATSEGSTSTVPEQSSEDANGTKKRHHRAPRGAPCDEHPCELLAAAMAEAREGTYGIGRTLNQLATAIGRPNPKTATRLAMKSALDQLARPGAYANDEAAAEQHGSRVKTHRQWRRRLQALIDKCEERETSALAAVTDDGGAALTATRAEPHPGQRHAASAGRNPKRVRFAAEPTEITQHGPITLETRMAPQSILRRVATGKRAHPGQGVVCSDPRSTLTALLKRRRGMEWTQDQRRAADAMSIDVSDMGDAHAATMQGGVTMDPTAGEGLTLRMRVEAALRDDPPLLGQPPRYAREVVLAELDASFEWPHFDAAILASHTCMMRETGAQRGLRVCSVAERRTVLEPSPGCLHVIGDVIEFMRRYPHPPPKVVDAHLTCKFANNASQQTWPDKIKDGSMLEAALEAADVLSWGERAALEQPPSAYQYILGQPTMKFNAIQCGDDRFKGVWYWTRGGLEAPTLPPLTRDLREGTSGYSSSVRENDGELRMLMRSTTSPYVAAALWQLWDPRGLPAATQSSEADRLEWLTAKKLAIHENFTIFAARYAPVIRDIGTCQLRMIVLVPITACGGIIAHVPIGGVFGMVAREGTALLDQAREGAEFLSGDVEPFLAGYTHDSQAHAIFVVPLAKTITNTIDTPEEWRQLALDSVKRSTGAQSAWCRADAIASTDGYGHVLMALARMRALVEPTPDSGLRIGCWLAPVHLVPDRLADEWRRRPARREASSEWDRLLVEESKRADRIRKAWIEHDTGDGRMVEWSANVRTAVDYAAELVPPPQGLPDFRAAVLRLTPVPKPPPYVTTAWLHSLPPQVVPPGFPTELEWDEVLLRGARVMVAQTLTENAVHEIAAFDMSAEEAARIDKRAPSLVIGPGLFLLRQHADGIGDYCMNVVFLANDGSGRLRPLDFAKWYTEHKNIQFICDALGGDGCSDQEIMSFLAEGACFKAHMPMELRIMRNVTSLDGRGRKSMNTFEELLELGAIEVMLVCEEGSTVDPDGPCPAMLLPGTMGSSGAADKPTDAEKGRMVINNTAPNGTIERPVRVRNDTKGEADGPHVLSLNESTGDKTPGVKHRAPGKPAHYDGSKPHLPREASAPVATHTCIVGQHAPDGVVDVRRRGGDSDAANPFIWIDPALHADSKEARSRVLQAMADSWDNPDDRLETVAGRHEGVRVHRHCRGYDGHVTVRAVQRFARRAMRGEALCFGCTCTDETCHRVPIATWTNAMVRDGLYARVPHPFPDPEVKMRPRHTYCATAVLSHMAAVDRDAGFEDAFLTGFTDDEKGCFWQWWTRASEYPHAQFHVALLRKRGDGTQRVAYYVGYYKVMNMGSRPSSKIQCRRAELWLDSWRTRMDAIAAEWLATRSPALQELVRERAETLSPLDARPFWADFFTDDYQFHFVSPSLAAKGAVLWNDMTDRGRIRMCSGVKKGLGTVVDGIGARNVLSGGFGTLLPAKRMRALTECSLAIEGKLAREEFEANNGLLVHADDIVNFPRGQLNGIWRPLQTPGWKTDLVTLTGDATARYREIVDILSTTAGASFLCAVPDAIIEDAHRGAPVSLVHMSSDACTDADEPAIFGYCMGVVWIFELDEEWLTRSINVTEATGRGINHLVYPKLHPHGELAKENDNNGASVAAVHRAHAEDLQHVQAALEKQPSYAAAAARSRLSQVQGIGNEVSDSGSRGKWKVLYAIAAALGVRLHWLRLRDFPEAITFLRDVLATTTPRECTHPNPPRFRCPICNRHLTAIERCLGVCPSCVDRDGARGKLTRWTPAVEDWILRLMPGSWLRPRMHKLCDQRRIDRLRHARRSGGTAAASTAVAATAAPRTAVHEPARAARPQIAILHEQRAIEGRWRLHTAPMLDRYTVEDREQLRGKLYGKSGVPDGEWVTTAAIDWANWTGSPPHVQTMTGDVYRLGRTREQPPPQPCDSCQRPLTKVERCLGVCPACVDRDGAALLTAPEGSPTGGPLGLIPPRRSPRLGRLRGGGPPACVDYIGMTLLTAPEGSPPGDLLGSIPTRRSPRIGRLRGGGPHVALSSPVSHSEPRGDNAGGARAPSGKRARLEATPSPDELPSKRACLEAAPPSQRRAEPADEPPSKRARLEAAPYTQPNAAPVADDSRRGKPLSAPPATPSAYDLPCVPSPLGEAGVLLAARLTPWKPGEGPRAPAAAQAVPADATAARAMAFEALEDLLANDDSEYALCPGDRATLHEIIVNSRELVLAGIPRGTLKADNNAVAYAARFCLRRNTPFMRPHTLANAGARARESFMYATFLVECAGEMKPRSMKRLGEDGTPITDAKPSSALGPLYGWRRVLRDGGCELPELRMISPHFKGLVAKAKAKYGARAQVPVRRVPFSQPQLHRVGFVLDKQVVSERWTATDHRATSVSFKFGLSTGSRIDELTHPMDHYRRSAFQIVLEDGTELPMTDANLRNVRDGTLLRGRTVPSKCDRSGDEWCDRDMWFRVRRSDPLNFAAAYIQWEIDYPCPPEQRGSWAAFSPDGGRRPFAASTLQSKFMEALKVAIGPEEAARRSYHALRVTAATALNTRKRPDGAIQCVLRWKTLDAMRLYAKMNRTNYADIVDEITTTRIEVTRVADLPALEPCDEVAALEKTLADLTLDEREVAAVLLDGKGQPGQQAGLSKAAGSGKKAAGKELAEAAAPMHDEAGCPLGTAEPSRRTASANGVAKVAPVTQQVEVAGPADTMVLAEVLLQDAWGLTGRPVNIHNNLWPQQPGDDWDPMGVTPCVVIGQCATPFDFGNGRSAAAYVIECEGVGYPIKESSLRTYFPKECRAKRKAPARA